MTAVSEQTGAWLAEFTRQKPAAPWLQEIRDDAFQRFAELGFPTTHDEEWRFTNVARIARATFEPQTAASGLRGLPAGVQLGTPQDAAPYLAKLASYQHNAFVALNTAFLGDFVFLRVPRGATIEEPIQLEFLTSGATRPAVSHPRVLIVVGADAFVAELKKFQAVLKKSDAPAVENFFATAKELRDHWCAGGASTSPE